MATVYTMAGVCLGVAIHTVSDAQALVIAALGCEIEEVHIVTSDGTILPPTAAREKLAFGDSVTAVVSEEPSTTKLRELVKQKKAQYTATNLTLLSPDCISELPRAFGRIYGHLHSLIIVDQEQIVSLPPSIGSLEYLIHLHIQNTSIRRLPKLSGLVRLTELRLKNNYICALTKLPSSVVTIDASLNQLTRLQDLAELPKLDKLLARGNRLKTLTCSRSHNIRELEMDSVLQVADVAGTLANLTMLHLSRVSIVGRPPLFLPQRSAALSLLKTVSAQQLRVLILRGCALKEFYSDEPLDVLIRLDLDHNELKMLPANAVCSRILQVVSVVNNKLNSLPATISSCVSLRELDVSNNLRLSTLPRDLGSLPDLKIIDVTGCYGLLRLPVRCAKKTVGWERH